MLSQSLSYFCPILWLISFQVLLLGPSGYLIQFLLDTFERHTFLNRSSTQEKRTPKSGSADLEESDFYKKESSRYLGFLERTLVFWAVLFGALEFIVVLLTFKVFTRAPFLQVESKKGRSLESVKRGDFVYLGTWLTIAIATLLAFAARFFLAGTSFAFLMTLAE